MVYKTIIANIGDYGKTRQIKMMTAKELIQYIEEKHWVDCDPIQIEEAIEYDNMPRREAEQMYNIWVPWHGWQAIKEKVKED